MSDETDHAAPVELSAARQVFDNDRLRDHIFAYSSISHLKTTLVILNSQAFQSAVRQLWEGVTSLAVKLKWHPNPRLDAYRGAIRKANPLYTGPLPALVDYAAEFESSGNLMPNIDLISENYPSLAYYEYYSPPDTTRSFDSTQTWVFTRQNNSHRWDCKYMRTYLFTSPKDHTFSTLSQQLIDDFAPGRVAHERYSISTLTTVELVYERRDVAELSRSIHTLLTILRECPDELCPWFEVWEDNMGGHFEPSYRTVEHHQLAVKRAKSGKPPLVSLRAESFDSIGRPFGILLSVSAEVLTHLKLKIVDQGDIPGLVDMVRERCSSMESFEYRHIVKPDDPLVPDHLALSTCSSPSRVFAQGVHCSLDKRDVVDRSADELAPAIERAVLFFLSGMAKLGAKEGEARLRTPYKWLDVKDLVALLQNGNITYGELYSMSYAPARSSKHAEIRSRLTTLLSDLRKPEAEGSNEDYDDLWEHYEPYGVEEDSDDSWDPFTGDDSDQGWDRNSYDPDA